LLANANANASWSDRHSEREREIASAGVPSQARMIRMSSVRRSVCLTVIGMVMCTYYQRTNDSAGVDALALDGESQR
jgi:hypothetical protein